MPKTLVEKLAGVFKSVDTVLKQGDNGEYAYLRIVDMSNAIREKLFAEGILIVPSDVEIELKDYSSAEFPERHWTEARVKTLFMLTDGSQECGFFAYGFGRDMDTKCVAIAQTAALKSFLKRLAMIFGENDDAERRDESIADLRPDLQRKIDEQTKLRGPEIRALYSALKKGGRSLEDLQVKLRNAGLADTREILQQDFESYMEWALNEQPTTTRT